MVRHTDTCLEGNENDEAKVHEGEIEVQGKIGEKKRGGKRRIQQS